MNILLACAMGMSTSILVSKMQKEAKQQNKKYRIWATSIDQIDEESSYDVVVLGPQVCHRVDEVREQVDSKIPVIVIDRAAYGACDGKAVLEAAEEAVNKARH